MATARLDLVVGLQGSQNVQSGLQSIGKTADATRQALAFMRAALVTLATVEIITRFTELADKFTLMENRLRILTNATSGTVATLRDFNLVSQGIIAISQQTGTSLDANALLFNRLARAVSSTGATYADVLIVTRAVAESVLISGANAVQAQQGMLQFAEGMGSGVLRGRQLRSVVQDFPALADAIASGFKGAGNGASLLGFALANPNVLKTPLVMKAIIDSAKGINDQFKTTVFTIGQGFTQINNAVVVFLGNLLNTTSVGRVVSQVLKSIADNIALVVAGFAALAAVFVFNILVAQLLLVWTRLVALVSVLTTVISLFTVFYAIIGSPVAFALLGGYLSTNETQWSQWAAVIAAYIATVADDISNLPKILANAIVKMGNEVRQLGNTSLGDFIDTITGHNPNFGGHLAPGEHPASQTLAGIGRGQVALPFPEIDADFQKQFQQHLLNGLVPSQSGPPSSGTLSSGKILSNILAPITDLGAKNINFDDIIRKLGLDKVPQIGKGSEEAAAKIKGLAQALAILSSVSPLVSFEKHMQDTATALEKAGNAAKAWGLTNDVVLDRERRNFIGIGNEIEFFKEKLIALTIAMGANGSTITAKEGLTVSLLGAGSSTLSDLQKLQDHVTEIGLVMKQFPGNTEAGARAIRDITGTTTEVDKLSDAFNKINTALTTGAISAEEYLKDVRAITGTTSDLDRYNDTVANLKAAWEAGALGVEEYKRKLEDANITFLNTQTDLQSGIAAYFAELHKQSTDVAGQVKTLLTDAFSSAQDALIQFVNTGKINFSSLINSIEADLLRLAFSEVEDSLIGQGSSTPGGSQNLISSLVNLAIGAIGGIGGGGAAGGIPTGDVSAGSFGGIPAMASGGSFDVASGSIGSFDSGIDNRLVAFKANDNEEVEVRPRGSGKGGTIINMHIHGVTDAASFGRSKDQIFSELYTQMARAKRRNG